MATIICLQKSSNLRSRLPASSERSPGHCIGVDHGHLSEFKVPAVSALCTPVHAHGSNRASGQILKFMSSNITLKVNLTPVFGEFKAFDLFSFRQRVNLPFCHSSGLLILTEDRSRAGLGL